MKKLIILCLTSLFMYNATMASVAVNEPALNKTYVTNNFLTWLDQNRAGFKGSTFNQGDIFDADDLYNFLNNAATSNPNNGAFSFSGDLGDIHPNAFDPANPADSPLGAAGVSAIFFISDGTKAYEDKMDRTLTALAMYNLFTPSSVGDFQFTAVVAVLTDDTETVIIDGEEVVVPKFEYDLIGNGTVTPGATTQVPIDGGLSFLALGGIAFGVARFRRKK